VRLLIDANLSPKVARALVKSGLDAVHVRDVGLLTAPDRSILDYPAANDLVIVSADSDFGEMLAASRGATRPSVVGRAPPVRGPAYVGQPGRPARGQLA
jgi:predicted nuclease of predicted toxin-antitoxin system